MKNSPIFRFAPSPNGRLHIGHAYSALLNEKLARQTGGKLLLRIEDIDIDRCSAELTSLMLEDLEWLGLQWDETPVKQSDRFDTYSAALERLRNKGLLYPSFMSRAEIKRWTSDNAEGGKIWPSDPDGVPLYPDRDKNLPSVQVKKLLEEQRPHSLRLDMKSALAAVKRPVVWQEASCDDPGNKQSVTADPARWGDVMLARRDIATSYHLSVVLDDAAQQVSHVVRGKDLYEATSIHRLLQEIMDLPQPVYCHHDLLLDDTGEKLSKSKSHVSLADLRSAGETARSVRKRLGFDMITG